MKIRCPACNEARPEGRERYWQWVCPVCRARVGGSVWPMFAIVLVETAALGVFTWMMIAGRSMVGAFLLVLAASGAVCGLLLWVQRCPPRVIRKGPCCMACGRELIEGVCHGCVWQRPK